MGNDPIKDLENLLETERTALVNGNLDALDQLTLKKEELIGAINDLKVYETEDLVRVQRQVARNQSLLGSAGEGIRAVLERMSELRRVQQEFSTYDASGQRSGYTVRAYAKLEKRA